MVVAAPELIYFLTPSLTASCFGQVSPCLLIVLLRQPTRAISTALRCETAYLGKTALSGSS